MSSKSERKVRRAVDKVASQFPHIQFHSDPSQDEARDCKVSIFMENFRTFDMINTLNTSSADSLYV